MQRDGETIIRVDGLLLRAIIGITDDERRDKQDLLIHLKLSVPSNSSLESDNILDTVNYRTICKSVINYIESKQPFNLLEYVVSNIADLILKNFPVLGVTVKVEKPHALRFADSVSIEMTRSRLPQE